MQLMRLSDEKFNHLVQMLTRVCDCFEKHPQVIQIIANEKHLRILLNSLAVLGPKNATYVAELLK